MDQHPDPSQRLEALRRKIRDVDASLIELIGRRRALALEIGDAKAALSLPVMDPSQEAKVVRRAAEEARVAGVDEELVRDVVWRIIASARDAQEGRSRWGPPADLLAEADGRSEHDDSTPDEASTGR